MTKTEFIEKWRYKIHLEIPTTEIEKLLLTDLDSILTSFWIWLVREAKIEVIDAENVIEVHGFLKKDDMFVPVVSFKKLLKIYEHRITNETN